MSRLEVMLRDFMCYIRNVLHRDNKIDQGNGQTSKHIALPFLQSTHHSIHKWLSCTTFNN
jgi:hypothetical protein